jgi:hypothetical protein
VGAVLQLLGVLLARTAAITGLVQLIASAVQTISNYLNPPTGVSQITAIQNTLISVNGDVENGTYGLAVLHTELVALTAAVTALGAPQQDSLPVILPTTPPTGYGGGSTATEVWEYTPPVGHGAMQDFMVNAGWMPQQMAWMQASLPMGFAPGWSLAGPWGYVPEVMPNTDALTMFDPATILTTDVTVGAWLDREYSGHGSSYDSLGRPVIVQPTSDWTWTYWMGAVEFEEYKAAAFGAPPPISLTAPVWPGLAKITWGTSVALEIALDVDVPMDGCVIQLSTVPPGKPTYQIGSRVATAHIGQLAFKDDDDDIEYPQNLSMDSQNYCPQTMAHATGVKIRMVPGVSGTVTPWTINP